MKTATAAVTSRDLVSALLQPIAHPRPACDVEHVETHISDLFLTADRVYKVKKSVDFGFLDFSTLERRRFFCHEEVRLNRRLAPDTYLGVVAVTRDGQSGQIRIATTEEPAPGAEVIDYAVEMHRLPRTRMLDHLLERGEIDNLQMNRLASRLERFHRAAATGEGVDEHGSLDAVSFNVLENFEQTEPYSRGGRTRRLVSPQLHAFLEARAVAYLSEHSDLFEERCEAGRIRDGHGDLHAGNVCYLEEEAHPATDDGLVIYDCIEFSDRLRCGDVACDLGFLAMDLDRRGFRGFSDYLVRRYVEKADDPQLLELLPFYKTYRAMVRAKIAAFRFSSATDPASAADDRAHAMRSFHLAASYQLPPFLLLTCGLPASGKSWAARAVAEPFEAVVLRSDRTRRRDHQLPPGKSARAPVGEGIYQADERDRTYASLLEETERWLQQGRTVVVDATFDTADRRRPFVELAKARGVKLIVLHVEASEDVIRERMAERERCAGLSEANWDVYQGLRATFEPPSEVAETHCLNVPSGECTAEELTADVIDRLVATA